MGSDDACSDKLEMTRNEVGQAVIGHFPGMCSCCKAVLGPGRVSLILRQPVLALMVECTASVRRRRLWSGACIGGEDLMYIGRVVGWRRYFVGLINVRHKARLCSDSSDLLGEFVH